jgi:hypothetical protein
MISALDFPSAVRRSAQAWVAGSEPSRVNTIRHKAWLAWRSPPGLSRWRVTFPDDAGIGAAPHRCAQAASERSRPGWSPAAMSSSAAVRGPIPYRASRPGARAVTRGMMRSSRRPGLAVQELCATSQFP